MSRVTTNQRKLEAIIDGLVSPGIFLQLRVCRYEKRKKKWITDRYRWISLSPKIAEDRVGLYHCIYSGDPSMRYAHVSCFVSTLPFINAKELSRLMADFDASEQDGEMVYSLRVTHWRSVSVDFKTKWKKL